MCSESDGYNIADVCVHVASEEVSEDAVYLLTKDEDEHTDKWTIVSNAKQLPLKNTDIISFELHKFVKGR
jgi:hypothetical protein